MRSPVSDNSSGGSSAFQRVIGTFARWPEFAVLSVIYFTLLLFLLPQYPLWLDEIIDLKAIRDFNLQSLLQFVPMNAGGVPLGYLTRFISVHLFGYSVLSARIPSTIFSVVACVGVFMIGRQAKLRLPLLAAIFFYLAPLQFRYAIESRPYSQVLALSAWASFALLKLVKTPTLTTGIFYAVLLLLGLYSQPYILFVAVGHLIWLCMPLEMTYHKRLKLLMWVGGAIAFACWAFLPWYLLATKLWTESVGTSHLKYQISGKAALLILRELVGAGYVGSALVIFTAVQGLKGKFLCRDERIFWVLQLVVPIIMAIVVDQMFGYFLAIRQMIFILVPLSLLAALGIDKLGQRYERTALVVGFVILFVFVFANVQFFRKPREDWKTAALVLQQSVAQGFCVIFSPGNLADVYSFVDPGLSRHICPTNYLRSGIGAVAIGSYGESDDFAIRTKLLKGGFKEEREVELHGPKIELYNKETH